MGDKIAVQSIFDNVSTSRKLFRLFKSLNDYQKMQIALKVKSDDMIAKIDKVIQVLIRVFFMAYWLIDNVMILRKILFNR